MATGVMLADDSRQYLVVQGEVLHVAADGFPGPGSHSHHLEPGLVQLLCQVINSHIGGCCHQDLHPALTLLLGSLTTTKREMCVMTIWYMAVLDMSSLGSNLTSVSQACTVWFGTWGWHSTGCNVKPTWP